MKEYEMIREIKNLCPNNQMRDISFSEIATDDPEEYVRHFLKGHSPELSVQRHEDSSWAIDAVCDGLMQRFEFTEIP